MAVVDLSSKRIYGCKKGSRVWWHEKGHVAFYHQEIGVKVNYYYSFFTMIAVFFIGLGVVTDSILVKTFGFINALGMILCYIYEEAWCWGYSFKKYR